MPASRRKILDHVFSGLSTRMSRKKKIPDDALDMPLRRSLSTIDLTLLGIGNMMAVGVYVVTGTVARDYAGPGAILSFLLAGASGLLACLNFAELGAAHPRAGSSYAFVYATVGEFWAFFIGWNLIMENIIGAAALARAWAGYLDSLTNGAVRNFTRGLLGSGAGAVAGQGAGAHLNSLLHRNASSAGGPGGPIGAHPPLLVEVDLLAVAIVLSCTLLLATGTRGSPLLGSILVVLNLGVIAMSVVFGFLNADIHNWNAGTKHGFLPFGWEGVEMGGAVCVYAFAGLESVLQGGQESRRPAYSIPAALLMSNAVTLSGYLLLSAALTLATPYAEICPAASLACALGRAGMHWARWPITCGALVTVASALLCTLMHLPRAIHAMAVDGLLFPFLGRVNAKTHVPLTNLLLVSVAVSCIALFFNLQTLVGMLSIGTIASHLSLAGGVIHSRYRPAAPPQPPPPVPTPAADSSSGLTDDSDSSGVSELASPISDVEMEVGVTPGSMRPGWTLFRKLGLHQHPPGAVIRSAYICFVIAAFTMNVFKRVSVFSYVGFIIYWLIAGVAVFFLTMIDAHQQTPPGEHEFRPPGMPYLAGISMIINLQLLMNLPLLAYLRFFSWSALGFVVYFLYGIRHSSEAERRSSYSVLLSGSGAWGGAWGAAWGGTLLGGKNSTAPAPATAPMLHAPQPPSHHDKLPILDYEEFQE